VDLALHDRPALMEVIGIVAACALLLGLLAKMDNQAAREYQARALRALAAQEAAQRTVAPAATARPMARVEARTESLGSRGPIAIPVGPAWTAGTSIAGHTRVERDPAPAPVAPDPGLRRIVGPLPVGPLSERTDPRPAPKPPKAVAPARGPIAAVADDAPRPTAPLMMLIVAGLLIAASGAVLSRRSA
jgi:hypothetical protein